MVLRQNDPGPDADSGREREKSSLPAFEEVTFFMGIDPGVSGGAAVIDNEATVHAFCNFSESERDISDWFKEWGELKSKVWAILECVHSMPKQGVTSTFKFGTSYGFLRGLLIAHRIPFRSIPPGTWQRRLSCLTKGDKKVTYKRAQEMFPEVKVTHAIADALLLAEFSRRDSYDRSR